jgi:hypothetical protein
VGNPPNIKVVYCRIKVKDEFEVIILLFVKNKLIVMVFWIVQVMFDPQDRGSMFLRNIDKHLQDYTLSQHGK